MVVAELSVRAPDSPKKGVDVLSLKQQQEASWSVHVAEAKKVRTFLCNWIFF